MSLPYKVLLIEDDADLALLMRLAMTRAAGWDVCVAGDRSEALKCAREKSPQIVIADLNLGAESGLDLVRDIRSVYPGIHTVLLTADMAALQRIRENDESLVAMAKPVNPRTFCQDVLSALGIE